MYVGRYDNSTGYMEWTGNPVSTIKDADTNVVVAEWIYCAYCGHQEIRPLCNNGPRPVMLEPCSNCGAL